MKQKAQSFIEMSSAEVAPVVPATTSAAPPKARKPRAPRKPKAESKAVASTSVETTADPSTNVADANKESGKETTNPNNKNKRTRSRYASDYPAYILDVANRWKYADSLANNARKHRLEYEKTDAIDEERRKRVKQLAERNENELRILQRNTQDTLNYIQALSSVVSLIPPEVRVKDQKLMEELTNISRYMVEVMTTVPARVAEPESEPTA